MEDFIVQALCAIVLLLVFDVVMNKLVHKDEVDDE